MVGYSRPKRLRRRERQKYDGKCRASVRVGALYQRSIYCIK